jgi:hypothetical protein
MIYCFQFCFNFAFSFNLRRYNLVHVQTVAGAASLSGGYPLVAVVEAGMAPAVGPQRIHPDTPSTCILNPRLLRKA